MKLFQLLQNELRSVTVNVSAVESNTQNNLSSIKQIEKKLEQVELRNNTLENENVALRERLLEFEYRQKRNNLLFEDVSDGGDDESDIQCINKLRNLLKCIPGLDKNFKIDKCHRVDGKFEVGKCRRILCTFNWYVDVQFILRNKKKLPAGVFVNEDYPEEWLDRRKILHPIFNAAKHMEKFKDKTHFSKDKLIIDKDSFSAGPGGNYNEANKLLDIKSTCERTNENTVLFLGSLSPFSNLHYANFRIDNIQYNCAEQFIQSEKAKAFNDDVTQYNIMCEENPYRIKKLGSRVRGFDNEHWKKKARGTALKANRAKFGQNKLLGKLLVETSKDIAEGSTDPYWGIGVHLRDRNALDRRAWTNKHGGAMAGILSQVRNELLKK